MANFVKAFTFHRQYQPDAPAVFFPDAQDRPATYSELDRIVAQAVARVAAAGLGKGDVAALDLSNEFLHAILLLACARLGVATVSGAPEAVQSALPAKAVFRDRQPAIVSQPSSIACPTITVDESWSHPTDDADPGPDLPTTHPDDLCRIMLTSGSTGAPKAVALTYRMVEQRINSYLCVFGSDFPNVSRLLCGMRLSSSLGFMFLFYTLARGGYFCSDSTSFAKIVGAITSSELQAMVTTPYTLAEIIKHLDEGSDEFARLRLVMVAGSLLSPQLAQRMRERLCERLIVFYGTTETGVVSALWESGEVGDVGSPVPGIHVDIVGTGGGPVPRGELGTIRIRGASEPLPFFDLTGWRQKTRKEWFDPGDVGLLDDQGHLVVKGRHDNVINIGGTKTTPELLEQSLLGAPGLRDCCVVCKRDEFGIDRIVAFLVLEPNWEQERFLAYCRARIVRDFLPSKFVLLKEIPRTPNSKVDREALSRQA